MDNLNSSYKKICSSETVYSHKNGFFYEFCELTKELIGVSYITKIFSNLKKDQDRLKQMYAISNINFINNLLNKITTIYNKKDAIKSKKKRIYCLHNKETEEFINLLHKLNQAVLLAPEIGNCKTDDGYTLPLALITRADLLLKQNDYVHTYKDLKIVLEMNFSFLNTSKIFQNILWCRSYQRIISLYDFKIKFGQKWKDNYGKYNFNRSSISNLVKIRKTILAGKEAAANDIINPGELLVIEYPTASCLLPQFYKSHCQTCLKRCKIIYGCPNCSAIAFCSYKCRSISLESFHKYECKISSLFIGSGMSILSHLALRIVTQLGLQKCIMIYNNLCKDQVSLELEDYLKLYNLERHISERSANDSFEHSLMAVFLLQCLKQVNFFHYSKENIHLNESKNEIIVGTLLLKHLQFLQFNAHEIYECNDETTSYMDFTSNPLNIGIGIYATVARFNHQCYSATIRYFYGNIIILRSSRLLQINDVIAENYGPVFTKKTVIERQRYLAGRYWFKCNCQACINNWPLLNQIEYTSIQIRCSSKTCVGIISVHLNQNIDNIYLCRNCGNNVVFSKLHQNIIKKCILWYAYGITIIKRHYMYEAAQILLTALKIFHHIANVPYRFTHLAETGLQYCLTKNK